MTACTVAGCDRRAIARGLCRMHYSRQRRGTVLRDAPKPVPPHGEHGVLARRGDQVQCHECGVWLHALGTHVHAHGMTAREYKLAYGLPLSKPLTSERVSERLSERSRGRVGTEDWARLEAARDPQAAADSRDESSFSSMRAHRNLDAARANGRAVGVVRSCLMCGAQWSNLSDSTRRSVCSDECQRAYAAVTSWHGGLFSTDRGQRRLREVTAAMSEGLTRREIAQRLGVSAQRVGQILQHLHRK